MRSAAALSVGDLRAEIKTGSIDTVAVAVVDMQGRLQGKRLHAPYFVDEVLDHGTECCGYLLAVDVDMNTVTGYEISSWDEGYGDLVMVPDLATLRRTPWQPGTALLLADLATHGLEGPSMPVSVSPREILRKQLDRLAQHGLVAHVGTELEFCVFRDTYEDAWRRGYRDLSPASLYNVDYSLLGTSKIEPLLRRIRTEMAGAGLQTESAKGECNLGQYEIAFRYAEAMSTADNHVLFKLGAKEIAAQENMALTFMAKPNNREGNSCHIHFSLRDQQGTPVMTGGPSPAGLSGLGNHVLAGLLGSMREMSLFYAPNINSYKRYSPGSFAPTAIRWGLDNRTCALRLVGRGSSLRVENRAPGGDVNPYLAIAAMAAGALRGIDEELELEPAFVGNAYADRGLRLPGGLRDALSIWESSDLARTAFGDDVVAHYANHARVELATFDAAVTDWELFRGFERM